MSAIDSVSQPFISTLNWEKLFFFWFAEWLKKENFTAFVDRQSKILGQEWLKKVEVHNCFYDPTGAKQLPFLQEKETEKYVIDIHVPIINTDMKESDDMKVFLRAFWTMDIIVGYLDDGIGASNPDIPADDPNFQQRNAVKNEAYKGRQLIPFERANHLRSWLMQTVKTKRSEFYRLHPEARVCAFTTNGMPITSPDFGMNLLPANDAGIGENIYQNKLAYEFTAYAPIDSYGTYYYLKKIGLDVKVVGLNFKQG